MTIMGWHTGTYEWHTHDIRAHTNDIRVHTNEYILVYILVCDPYVTRLWF